MTQANRVDGVVAVLVFVATLVAGLAFAGERFLTSIGVADAGIRHNYSQCTECAANLDAGADGGPVCPAGVALGSTTCDPLPANALLTVQCDYDAYLLTDVTTFVLTGAGNRPLKAKQDVAFPTSTGNPTRLTYISVGDGGTTTVRTALVSVKPVDGGSVTCNVFERTGKEF